MKKDYFHIAIRNLKSRTLRSWLTIFGIVIGVFLVMALISLSEGIKGAILKELKMMGSDVLMVYPGESFDVMTAMSGDLLISEEDTRAMKNIEGVKAVIPMNWSVDVARAMGEKKIVYIFGVPLKEGTDFLINKMGWKTTKGRFPVAGRKETMIGAVVSTDVFKGADIGDKISISGTQFEIVGVLRSLGNKSDDSSIIIDLEIFKNITGKRKGSPYVMVEIKPGYSQDEVAENIRQELNETRKRQRGKDLPPFSVVTSEKMMDMVGNIMGIIQAAIFAIAGFAILVGAIGIMNSMYTSVRERTKEIGIMKAVGAKRSDITWIFLIESGIMGTIGGIGGTVFGLGTAKLIEVFMSGGAFALKAYISFPLVLFGLLFTFIIGCLSGYLPARRAAMLKPVDALHYE